MGWRKKIRSWLEQDYEIEIYDIEDLPDEGKIVLLEKITYQDSGEPNKIYWCCKVVKYNEKKKTIQPINAIFTPPISYKPYYREFCDTQGRKCGVRLLWAESEEVDDRTISNF